LKKAPPPPKRGLDTGARDRLAWRMRKTLVSVLTCALCVVLSGCNKGTPTPTDTPNAAPSPAPTISAAQPEAKPEAPAKTAGKYGAPLSNTPAVDAKTVLSDPQKWNDKDVKLSGKVSGVCQKKGCWMTLQTGEPGAASVRVTFKDYGFFVPKDSFGKTATVEGKFAVKTISVAEAQHFADDAAKEGSPPRKVTEPEHTFSLVATGVEIQ